MKCTSTWRLRWYRSMKQYLKKKKQDSKGRYRKIRKCQEQASLRTVLSVATATAASVYVHKPLVQSRPSKHFLPTAQAVPLAAHLCPPQSAKGRWRKSVSLSKKSGPVKKVRSTFTKKMQTLVVRLAFICFSPIWIECTVAAMH